MSPRVKTPHRWPRAAVGAAIDNFSDPDHPSQRQYAEQHGIPHATFNYWTRHSSPAEGDPIDSFFCSACGEAVLRRIVVAALTTFQLQGAGGIRPIGTFLQRAGLDRFVATSRGALHPLAAHLETDLVAFRDQEQPGLAQQMKPKTITVVADEHFHSGQPCLVGLEPVAGFLLVECYRDQRDSDTWEEAIREGTRAMPVAVVQMTSDQARALVCCAENGFDAAHSPDLFHGQRDLHQPLLLPLARQFQQAQKELEKAKKHTDKVDSALHAVQTQEKLATILASVRHEKEVSKRREQAQELKDQAVAEVRGVGDDNHPFDRDTGQPVTAEAVGQRLAGHVEQLVEVAREAALGEKAHAALKKARTWLATLMGCVAWFWCRALARVEELDLSQEQECVVYGKLLAGH